MVYLIVVTAILWFAVSALCINNYLDFTGADDEWGCLSFPAKLLIYAVAPVLYLYWNAR